MTSSRRGEPSLDLVEQVLVDGDNLLHAVRGSRDPGGVAWLLPRLAAWRPEGVHVEVVLDGHPAPGLSDRRPAAKAISIRHAGSISADDRIVLLLEGRPYLERAHTVVVTADRHLQARVRTAGALVRSVDWLVGQLAAVGRGPADGGPPRVGIGRGAAPRNPAPAAEVDASEDDQRRAWQTGRGATRKQGNPRRTPKRSRPR